MKKMKEFIKSKLNIILTFVIIILAILIVMSLNATQKKIRFNLENLEEVKHFDKIILDQYEIYGDFINQENNAEENERPYEIPNFSYLEGTLETGYVIVDIDGNEFVWVPCSNMSNDNLVKLSKQNFTEEIFVDYNECYDDVDIEKFLNSVLENKGFYISRYEIGIENEKPVSKKDVQLMSNVTHIEATEIAQSMYENINSELINGYAYDTTIKWIKSNNDLNITDLERYKTEKEAVMTGVEKYNNIYDIFDSIGEITAEKHNGYSIYRTVLFMGDIETIQGLFKEDIIMHERILLDNEETYTNIGFRTIIYK